MRMVLKKLSQNCGNYISRAAVEIAVGLVLIPVAVLFFVTITPVLWAFEKIEGRLRNENGRHITD